MKKIYLLFFILIFSYNHLSAQAVAEGPYKWTQEVIMTRCSITGQPDTMPSTNKQRDTIRETSYPGQYFRVIDVKPNYAIIKIVTYKKNTSDYYRYNYKNDASDSTKQKDTTAIKTKNSKSSDNNTGKSNNTNTAKSTSTVKDTSHKHINTTGDERRRNQIYFEVPINLINSNAVSDNYNSFALDAGVINFPYKYRLQKTSSQDFSGAFNFGAGIELVFPHYAWRNFTYALVGGYSIASINIDSVAAIHNQNKLASTNGFTAFSASIGFMITYQKAQAGIFLGWDRISRENQIEYGWLYQGKPWISVGLGISIFSTEVATGTGQSQTSQ